MLILLSKIQLSRAFYFAFLFAADTYLTGDVRERGLDYVPSKRGVHTRETFLSPSVIYPLDIWRDDVSGVCVR